MLAARHDDDIYIYINKSNSTLLKICKQKLIWNTTVTKSKIAYIMSVEWLSIHTFVQIINGVEFVHK